MTPHRNILSFILHNGIMQTNLVHGNEVVCTYQQSKSSMNVDRSSCLSATGRLESCRAAINCRMASGTPDSWRSSKKILCTLGNTSVTLSPTISCSVGAIRGTNSGDG